MIGFKKCFLNILIIFALIFIPIFTVLCVPVKSASAQISDWEVFDSSISQMYEYDEKPVILQEEQFKIEEDRLYIDEEVAFANGIALSDDTVESKFKFADLSFKYDGENVCVQKPLNRLIVQSKNSVEDDSAVLSAHFNGWHVFQYENFEKTLQAYNDFVNNCFDVNFDIHITAEDVEQDFDSTELEDLAYNNGNFSYKSWGASYLGWQTYTERLLDRNEFSELPTVYVGVVDSGINTSHNWFKNRIATNLGRNFTGGLSSNFEDGFGHGTHVSGIIADATLENVKIVPLKVLDNNGDGTVLMLINALEYIKDLNANKSNVNNNIRINVINMSLGIDSSSVEGLKANYTSTDLQNAVVSLYKNGVLSVVSAGNENLNTAFAYPANVTEAITVSALKRGLSFDGNYSNFGSHVDFSAPGTSIESAYIKTRSSEDPKTVTRSLSGTSMAAPHVTACYALVLSNPYYYFSATTQKNAIIENLSNITELLKQNATDLGVSGRDDYYGWGCINVLNIDGLRIQGDLKFEQISSSDSEICVKLSFKSEEEGNVKIYYTTNPFKASVDRSDTEYVEGREVVLNKTTKLTAIAYVFDENNHIKSSSSVVSQTYYLNNEDLITNFTYNKVLNGDFVSLSNYSGNLTTLRIPDKVEIQENVGNKTVLNTYRVGQIGDNTFFNKKIETLFLPNTITYFGEYLFGENETLVSVLSYESDSMANFEVTIAADAFNSCYNLSNFQIKNITSVGDRAFIRCKSLLKLDLPIATYVGTNAFSESGIEELVFAGKLQTLKNQTNMNLKKVYGFAFDFLKDFANANNAQFVDLSLRFENNISSSKIIDKNDLLVYNIEFVGYSDTPVWTVTLDNRGISADVSNDLNEKYKHTLNIDIGKLSVGLHNLAIKIYDSNYSYFLEKNIVINVKDDSVQTFKINFSGSDKSTYSVKFGSSNIAESDYAYLENNDLLLVGQSYTLVIEAEGEYSLTYVSVDGKNIPLIPDVDSKATVNILKKNGDISDVNIIVNTKQRESLIVEFVYSNAEIEIVSPDNVNLVLNQAVVDRKNNNLSFTVTAHNGFRLRNISTQNGEMLFADIDGVFHLDNITQNLQVIVNVIERTFRISLQNGKGGAVSIQEGEGGVDSSIGYGKSKTYKISSEEGFVIDYVLVNGKRVEIVDNTFTLSNVTEDINIFISFKKSDSSIPSSILSYFITFAVIFVIFIGAKIIITIVKKKDNNKKNN